MRVNNSPGPFAGTTETKESSKSEASKPANSGMEIVKDGFDTASKGVAIEARSIQEAGQRKSTGITGPLKLKVASESLRPANIAAGKISTVATSSSQRGTKDLTLDQARLAARINYDAIPHCASQEIDGRALYESRKDGNDGGSYGGNSTSQDAQDRLNAQRGLTAAAEIKNPTGPAIDSAISRLTQNDTSVENSHANEGKGSRDQLRDGATGNALLESTSKDQRKQTANIKEKGAVADKTDEVVDAVASAALVVGGAVGGAGAAAAAAALGVFAGALAATHKIDKALDNALSESVNHADNKSDILQDELNKRAVENAKKQAERIKSWNQLDGNIVNQNGQGKGSSVTDPGENPGVSPESLGLGGYRQLSPGAVFHQNSGSKDGNIDPDSSVDSQVTGMRVNDAQTHLGEMGKYGMIGQPDTSHSVGGNSERGLTGSSQSGGDIDMGPDSTKQGYDGPTRTQDPGDVQFGAGQPLIGLNRKADEDEDQSTKTPKKKGHAK